MSDSKPVWLITGCSTGLGRELAQRVIHSGANVVVTARDVSRVTDLAKGHEDRVLTIALDVNDTAQIKTAVKAAEDKFGRIDVLVNNAGYGYQSTVEEADDAEIRAQFEANVFGLFAVTQAVLPGMRTRRKGHIFNITSVAGIIGFPGSSFYAASKHAVEGWAEGLAAEVEPLGIKVTCIEPGPFRTDWAGRSLIQTPSKIADYAETAAARMRGTSEGSGKQAGDPALAAQAMIDLVGHANPPHHLVLGVWGVKKVADYFTERQAEIKAWRAFGEATDFASKD
jgi:NAD(P)-dependent dehydrogenase (short-subunit alcohol dehydrogenase family)